MGSGCDQPENNPNYANVCSDSLGDLHTIGGICLDPEGVGGICSNIGVEWVGAGVQYNNEACPCYGAQPLCKRVSFAASNQKQCCLQNYDGTQNNDDCFINGVTCPPENRGPLRPGCRDLFSRTCAQSSDPSDATYEQYWSQDNFCELTLGNNVQTPSGVLYPEGIVWAQAQMSNLMQTYFSDKPILPPGQAGPFQDRLIDICMAYPSACDLGLKQICGQYSRLDAEGNRNILSLCGCHLNKTAYTKYQDEFGISYTCDPICSRTDVVPPINNDFTNARCQGSVCIIDDVTLVLVNSDVPGEVNFQQACGGCGGATSCTCILSDVSIIVVESTLGDIDLDQACGSQPKCYTTNPDDPTGPALEVNCETGLPEGTYPIPEEPTANLDKIQIIVISIVGVIIIVAIILILVFILEASKKRKVEFELPNGKKVSYREYQDYLRSE